MKKIMFVCTGNICRSAMAHFLMQNKLKQLGLENIAKIFSSGTYAYDGELSTYEATKVMKEEYGIDMSSHRATPARNSNVEDMDLVLCMTNSHKGTLELMYPEIKNKVFLLKEYVSLGTEIADPYGFGMEIYKSCAKEINECIDALIKKEFGVIK